MVKKVLLIVAAVALCQTQVFAGQITIGQCRTTNGPNNLPFYQVLDIGGDSAGNGGKIMCFYQDSEGRSNSYTAAQHGAPDTNDGARWAAQGEGLTRYYVCGESAETCLFYITSSANS